MSNRGKRLRRDLRLLTGDATCWALMTGTTEWQVVLFALAIGMTEVASGLLATIPVLIGATLQLLTPWGLRRVGSIRKWVVGAAILQTLSIVPLALGAAFGGMPWWALYLAVALYWASGYATGPPWQTWFTSLVPRSIRAVFLASRARYQQAGLALGILAGLLLQAGESGGWLLGAFAVVFSVAVLARSVSTVCLANQTDADPALAKAAAPISFSMIKRDFGDARTRRLLLYMLAFFLSVFMTAPFFIPYLREELKFEYWQVTLVLFVMIGTKVLVLPFVGRFAKRHGPGPLLWIGAIATTPIAALWTLSDSFWYIMSLQLLAAAAWACWETATWLLVFDVIPAERRTGVMTVYQFAQASAFTMGSLMGASVLGSIGVGAAGYAALFLGSSGLRFVTLFMLGSFEPSGLRLRHRLRVFLPGAAPQHPEETVAVFDDDDDDMTG